MIVKVDFRILRNNFLLCGVVFFLQCKITKPLVGDGIDNDCDNEIDEEVMDGKDNDGDGKIDEDLELVMLILCSA